MNSSLPLGVAILAVLVGILGFFILIGGILLLAGYTVGSIFGVPGFFGVGGLVLALIVTVVGIIVLAIAFGLWNLNMVALVLAVLFTLFEMVVYGLAGDFISVGFILSLIVFIYLLAVSNRFS
jgi:hypothetical protein